MQYDILYIDCPWLYDNQQQNDPARGGKVYDTLSMNELVQLPIEMIAAPNCVIAAWWTGPKLIEAMPVWCAWQALGFRPVTSTLFVWVKLNKNGKALKNQTNGDVLFKGGVYSGLGHYTNQNIEAVALFRRGNIKRIKKDVKQLVFAPIGCHSAKPAVIRDRLVELFGDRPRIELFARERAPGWQALGRDIDGLDIYESIVQESRRR
jgi:N6-adenosine-specific RNA methylase IME4